ncbi:MAG: radical SAM protein [Cyanobacteria bacterium P01_A01_bin.17]
MRIKRPLKTITDVLVFKTPLEAQLIITRRCNLSCGYCTEYDHTSAPIPLSDLKDRIDAIHRLGVINISLLGGEPLMHPDLMEIIEYGSRHSQVSMTTNGFLLKKELIDQLNVAGLSNLQISIDALESDPTHYIQKSLNKLISKLELLKEHATFDVHANVVMCEATKDTFTETVNQIRGFGFYVSVGLIHDDRGQVQVQGDDYIKLWDQHFANRSSHTSLDYNYGRQLLQGQQPEWICRAGSRFLYIDEFGLTQYCSSQRNRLNKPITDYTRADLQAQFQKQKGCESGCSILCVYRDSMLDNQPLAMVKDAYQSWQSGSISF